MLLQSQPPDSKLLIEFSERPPRGGLSFSAARMSAFGGDLNRSTQHFILKRKDGVDGDASRIFSRFQKGARFIGVFASLSEQGGTPAQLAAKPSGFETPAEI